MECFEVKRQPNQKTQSFDTNIKRDTRKAPNREDKGKGGKGERDTGKAAGHSYIEQKA